MKVTLVRSTVSGRCGWLALAVSQHCSNSRTHAPASLPSSAMRRWLAVSWTVILSIVPPSLASSAASAWRQGIPMPRAVCHAWGSQRHTEGLCRKFSFEAIYGMISLHDQQRIIEEHDDGDQFQRGPFPPRDYPDGCALVCRVPAQHAPRRRTHGGTWGPRGSLHD